MAAIEETGEFTVRKIILYKQCPVTRININIINIRNVYEIILMYIRDW